MSGKTLKDKQPSEPELALPIARNGNGEVFAEQPEIDDIYSPDFLTNEDAMFLLEAERTSKPTSRGKVLPRRPPQ